MKIQSKTAQLSFAGLTVVSMVAAASYYLYHNYYTPSADPLAAFSSAQSKLEEELFANGNAAFAKQDYGAAVQYYAELIKRNPTIVGAQFNLGLSLEKIGRADLAQAQFEKVVGMEPKHAQAHLQIGNLLQTQKQFELSIGWYQKALALDPTNANVSFTIATNSALQKTDAGYALALELFNKLIGQRPDDLSLLLQLGNLHISHGKLEQAQATYQKLVALAPTSGTAKLALGQSYERQNNIKKAFELYQEAVKLEPNNAMAHVALAGAYWVLGDTEKGFKEYEWRWQISNMANAPLRWDGSHPIGKTILLLGENGLGDVFQFVRFAAALKKQGTKVIARVNKPLIPLLSLCDYIDEIVAPGDETSKYDALTSFQSLPALMHISADNFPKPPYLKANPALIQQWKQRLAGDKNFKIGICWQSGGDIGHIPQGKRSVPLTLFAQLGELHGITLYSLQKGDEALEKLKQLRAGHKVIDFGNELDSHGAFMDTAALMRVMDLIITVDTSVAHLAGALNVPTWTILPYHPDPRWMHDRSDTFWYPSMTLFRQTRPGDWKSIIGQVKTALKQKVGRRSKA